MTLQDFFKAHNKIAIGFSGGVDSTYLFYEALRAGADVRAYYVKSAFQPEFELEDAKKLVRQLNAEECFEIIPVDILSCENVMTNPKNRCYYCKTQIFGTIIARAKKDGYTEIIDGTNASDEVEDRPGMKALEEMSVYSPLRICGLTKAEIRKRSKEAGLFTWNKPAYACLATRIPTDTIIDADILLKIESAEEVLFKENFTDFRVRVQEIKHVSEEMISKMGIDREDEREMLESSQKRYFLARIELPRNQMAHFIDDRSHLVKQLQEMFPYVMLDLKGR